jgi:hypothetical protein
MMMQGEWRNSSFIVDGRKVDVIDLGSCPVLDSDVDGVEHPPPPWIL